MYFYSSAFYSSIRPHASRVIHLWLPGAVGRSVSLIHKTVYGDEDQLTVDLQGAAVH